MFHERRVTLLRLPNEAVPDGVKYGGQPNEAEQEDVQQQVIVASAMQVDRDRLNPGMCSWSRRSFSWHKLTGRPGLCIRDFCYKNAQTTCKSHS